MFTDASGSRFLGRKITTGQLLVGALKYLNIRARRSVLHLNLEVTKHCNAKCDFCNYWHTRKEEKLDDYLPVIRRINPFVVSLTGGEPLLRKDITKIIRRLSSNFKLTYLCLVTNGSLLTVQKAKELWEAGLHQLSISLNYLGEKQDKERGIPGLYAHLSELIPQLPAIGIDNVALNTVIMRDNIDQVIGIAKQAHEWGVKVAYSCYCDAKTGNRSHWIASDELEQLRRTISDLLHLKPILGNISSSNYYLENVPIYFEKGFIKNCQAGKSFLQVTPNGYIKPCPELEPFCYYLDYEGQNQSVSCGCCWYSCRGEIESPMNLKRLWELVT